jgi:Tfp pilus assembly protein PilO
MTAVNLVPVVLLDRRRRRAVVRGWSVGVVVCAVACGLGVAAMRYDPSSRRSDGREELAKLERRLEDTKAELVTIKGRLETAKTQATVALRIGERPDWSGLLTALSGLHAHAAARRIVLEPATEGRGEADDAGAVRIRIEGVARTQVDAQEYIVAFERLGLCEEVAPEPTRPTDRAAPGAGGRRRCRGDGTFAGGHAVSKPSSLWGPKFARMHVVGAVCCGVCVAGLMFGGVLPRSSRDRVDADMLEQRRVMESAIAAAVGEVDALRAELSGYDRVIQRGAVTLGTIAERNERLGRLAALAGSHGLRLDSIEPGELLKRPLYQVLPLRMSGGGTAPAFGSFHSALLEEFEDMAVRSFDLAAGSAAGDGTFRVELAWYLDPAGGK